MLQVALGPRINDGYQRPLILLTISDISACLNGAGHMSLDVSYGGHGGGCVFLSDPSRNQIVLFGTLRKGDFTNRTNGESINEHLSQR